MAVAATETVRGNVRGEAAWFVLQRVRALGVVGEENEGVVWSLGPPQFTTHASIVSKLFSLPANVRNIFISFHLVLMSQ